MPHQRERERSKAVPSSLYRFSKVIVIFAYVPQKRAESQSFCANELWAFFFLRRRKKKKYEHPKQCNTPDAVFVRRRSKFSFSLPLIRILTLIRRNTLRERERESRRNALKRAHRKIYIIGGTKRTQGTNCDRVRFWGEERERDDHFSPFLSLSREGVGGFKRSQ